MFHALCTSNANTLIGFPAGPPYPRAWTRAYRAMDHRRASTKMSELSNHTSPALQYFGATFNMLQEHHHKSDYDPEARFLRSGVVNLIGRAETATEAFLAADAAERKELAASILLRDR